MVVSNEPGYYEDGAFGIRIENLLICKAADTQYRFGGEAYYNFERLTFCPLQRKLLAPEVSPSSWEMLVVGLLPLAELSARAGSAA